MSLERDVGANVVGVDPVFSEQGRDDRAALVHVVNGQFFVLPLHDDESLQHAWGLAKHVLCDLDAFQHLARDPIGQQDQRLGYLIALAVADTDCSSHKIFYLTL